MVLSSVVDPLVPTFFNKMEAVLRLAMVAPVSNLENIVKIQEKLWIAHTLGNR